jgi:hypothetical protein
MRKNMTAVILILLGLTILFYTFYLKEYTSVLNGEGFVIYYPMLIVGAFLFILGIFTLAQRSENQAEK